MKVGVIGLGSMGMGAALSLLRAGHEVTGCDMRQAARDEFAAAGGGVAASANEIPVGTEALVVLVVNAAQTEAALFGEGGAAGRLAPGAVIVSSATMGPDAARALAEKARERQLLFLDAPVSGGAVKARAGEMTVMASGSQAAFGAAQPVLDAIAAKVWHLGEEPGIGATVKVVHQLLAGVHIAVAAEAMALGIRAGADPRQLYDVVTSAAGNSWMFENRMARVLDGDDAPRSAVDIFVKDLGLVLDTARASKFPLPLSSTAHQMFMQASTAGHAREDDSAVIKIFPGITLPAKA